MYVEQDGKARVIRPRRRRWVVAAALTGALIAGTLAVGGQVVAQTGDDTGAGESEKSTGEWSTSEGALAGWLEAALEPLVTAGTIGAEQRDAITEALLSARGSAPHGGWHRWGHGLRAGGADELADLLGLERSELHDRLRAGETPASLAESSNVEVDAVIELFVGLAVARLDAALEAGRLNAESHQACVAAAEAYATARVHGERPAEGTDLRSCTGDDHDHDNRRGRGHRGRGGLSKHLRGSSSST